MFWTQIKKLSPNIVAEMCETHKISFQLYLRVHYKKKTHKNT